MSALVGRVWSASWAPLSVVVLHSALSAAGGHRRDYDPLFHFAGGAAGAHCLLQTLRLFRPELGPVSRLNPVLVVLAIMVAAVGLWELAEFASDRFLGTHVQPGTRDTVMDIALGLGGTLVTLGAATLLGSHGVSATVSK